MQTMQNISEEVVVVQPPLPAANGGTLHQMQGSGAASGEHLVN